MSRIMDNAFSMFYMYIFHVSAYFQLMYCTIKDFNLCPLLLVICNTVCCRIAIAYYNACLWLISIALHSSIKTNNVSKDKMDWTSALDQVNRVLWYLKQRPLYSVQPKGQHLEHLSFTLRCWVSVKVNNITLHGA